MTSAGWRRSLYHCGVQHRPRAVRSALVRPQLAPRLDQAHPERLAVELPRLQYLRKARASSRCVCVGGTPPAHSPKRLWAPRRACARRLRSVDADAPARPRRRSWPRLAPPPSAPAAGQPAPRGAGRSPCVAWAPGDACGCEWRWRTARAPATHGDLGPEGARIRTRGGRGRSRLRRAPDGCLAAQWGERMVPSKAPWRRTQSVACTQMARGQAWWRCLALVALRSSW